MYVCVCVHVCVRGRPNEERERERDRVEREYRERERERVRRQISAQMIGPGTGVHICRCIHGVCVRMLCVLAHDEHLLHACIYMQ